jgi:hypothetical protein
VPHPHELPETAAATMTIGMAANTRNAVDTRFSGRSG